MTDWLAIRSGSTWRAPQPHAGAGEKIMARLPELEAAGWTPRELWQLDPTDPNHGHHGLLFRLPPGWRIGRIGRALIELIGPPDGGGRRSRLEFPRRRTPELLADPAYAERYKHERRLVVAAG